MKKFFTSKAFLISVIAVSVLGISAFIYTRKIHQNDNPNSQADNSIQDHSSSQVTQSGGLFQNQQNRRNQQNQQSQQNQQPQQKQPAVRKKSYPVGEWQLPIPFINPFGSQNNYKTVDYTTNKYEEFSFVGKDNMETTRTTCGEVWTMAVAWQDSTMGPFEDLELYLSEISGEIYQRLDRIMKWFSRLPMTTEPNGGEGRASAEMAII